MFNTTRTFLLRPCGPGTYLTFWQHEFCVDPQVDPTRHRDEELVLGPYGESEACAFLGELAKGQGKQARRVHADGTITYVVASSTWAHLEIARKAK